MRTALWLILLAGVFAAGANIGSALGPRAGGFLAAVLIASPTAYVCYRVIRG